MSERQIEAAYTAFLRELDDGREALTFTEEDAIRAALRAAERVADDE